MKTIDKTKLTVLSIGMATIIASLFGAISTMNLVNFLVPLYIGLSLTGLTVLHKDENLGHKVHSN